ncbi:MAG: sigma-70 family RNA polymerase sigma factor [Pirellulales bacterium]
MYSFRPSDQTDDSGDDKDDPFAAALNAARGSDSALGRLFEGCRDYLLLVANDELPSDVRQKVAASDLVQETFIEARHSLAEFRGAESGEFRAWMRRILVNNVNDAIRKYRNAAKRSIAREVPVDEATRDQAQANGFASLKDTPSKTVAKQEERQRVAAQLETLPDDHRRVIMLRNYEQRTFVEIGHLMEKTPDAVRMLWGRAIRKLATAMGPDDERSTKD